MAEGGIGELWQKHPYAVAGGVFVIGAIVIYYYFGGSSAGSSGNAAGYYAAQAAAVTSGNQLAAAQLGAAVQSNAIQGEVQVEQSKDAAAIALGQIAGNTSVVNTQTTQYYQAETVNIQNTLAAQLASHEADLQNNLDLTKEYESANLLTNLQNFAYWRPGSTVGASFTGGGTGGITALTLTTPGSALNPTQPGTSPGAGA
jgi:hypothetical protein